MLANRDRSGKVDRNLDRSIDKKEADGVGQRLNRMESDNKHACISCVYCFDKNPRSLFIEQFVKASTSVATRSSRYSPIDGTSTPAKFNLPFDCSANFLYDHRVFVYLLCNVDTTLLARQKN